MRQLKSGIHIIFFILVFFSCKKEYSLEGALPATQAKFSLSGAPGRCTDAVIKGSYKTTVALTSSYTAKIYADVTKTGSYSISTSLQNGIRFSASGNFISTGNQAVILIGSGTPSEAGVFYYKAGSDGCIFSIDVINSNSGSALFTYNGAPGPCTNVSVNGNYKTAVLLVATNIVKIDLTVLRPGNYSITTSLLNGISFSGTGFFPTIGYQVVTLTGSGTPITDGVNIFTPSNNGCPFPIVVYP